MTVLRSHEVEVVKALASGCLSARALGEIIDEASLVELDETGVGYFITVKHSALPEKRVVCQDPLLLGRSGDVECGFVIFLESGLLTLECHSWGDASIPAGFREFDVAVGESA